MISLQNVVVQYGQKNPVTALKGVTLQIFSGDFMMLVGPSGSGKSTLLNVLGLTVKVTSGQCHLQGEDVARLSFSRAAAARNQKIGFVFQSYYLLPELKVWENVALPLGLAGVSYRERKRRAMLLLERVGLSDKVNRRPSELSGGQQQRVAIARALSNSPDLLLADEPTGNLDTATAHEIMEIFRELNEEGKTIVFSTHNPSLLHYANRVVRIQDGELLSVSDLKETDHVE